jgi:hypothetical protein
MPCPSCKGIGCLIFNGLVPQCKGCPDQNRGQRIYCNTRRCRGIKGCGKSFSLMHAMVLKHLTINTEILWKFLSNIAAGMTSIPAFAAAQAGTFSDRTIHRLRSRFTRKGSAIRTMLSTICPPPTTVSSKPIVQTINHLQAAFATQPCPISAFQLRFQTAFL